MENYDFEELPLEEMNIEELESLGNEKLTGDQHRTVQGLLAKRLVEDYAECVRANGEATSWTAFVNKNDWTPAMWRYVGDSENPSRYVLEAYARQYVYWDF